MKTSRKTKSSVKPNLNVKPITGGDGGTPETAAVVNCASQGMANSLIDKFISEQHGTKDTAWKHSMSFFVNKEGIPEYSVRSYGIELQNGNSFTYYFDISRPHNNEMNMFNRTSGNQNPDSTIESEHSETNESNSKGLPDEGQNPSPVDSGVRMTTTATREAMSKAFQEELIRNADRNLRKTKKRMVFYRQVWPVLFFLIIVILIIIFSSK